MSLEELFFLRNQQKRLQQNCVREDCSISIMNCCRQLGSHSHGCLAASILCGAILFCLQGIFVVAMTYTYHQLKALWQLRDLTGLHERQQAQRRKLKTLRRRCIRIYHRLQECEDAYNSDVSLGNWYCGPSLSTQGSGTEDEKVNDDVGAPNTFLN